MKEHILDKVFTQPDRQGHIQRNKAHLKALKSMNTPEAVKAAEEKNRKRLEEKKGNG